MLVYIEFNDESCGYYECKRIFISNKNIESSQVYTDDDDGFYFFSFLKRVTLCKDGGEFSKTIFERRD